MWLELIHGSHEANLVEVTQGGGCGGSDWRRQRWSPALVRKLGAMEMRLGMGASVLVGRREQREARLRREA
jgi:hypothetical protein